MPVTCMSFKYDMAGDAEYVATGSPDYTYNIIPVPYPFLGGIIGKIWSLIWPLLIIAIVLDWSF